MSECESIQDRMPLIASGAAVWTDPESAHLAGCADCSATWQIVETARALGESAARRVDPAQVGGAVLARLREERRAARWKRGGWIAGLAAAAAIVLIVWGKSAPGGLGGPSVPVAAVTQPLRVPLAELERLDAAQLEAVLDGIDQPLGAGAAPDAPHLGDLDDHELERVLRSLEG